MFQRERVSKGRRRSDSGFQRQSAIVPYSRTVACRYNNTTDSDQRQPRQPQLPAVLMGPTRWIIASPAPDNRNAHRSKPENRERRGSIPLEDPSNDAVHPAHRGAPADHEPRGRVGRATIDPSFDLGSQRDCQRPGFRSHRPTIDARVAFETPAAMSADPVEQPSRRRRESRSHCSCRISGVAQNILDFRTDREPSRDAKNGQPR